MVAGRFGGRRLMEEIRPQILLVLSVLIAAAGFLLFWLGNSLFVSVLGLAILGLGQSNIYPLALSEAIRAAGDQGAKATSRMSLGTGSAILLAPLILGTLADRYGLFQAHAIVAAIFVSAAVATIAVHSSTRRVESAGLAN
jgi:fucose permease